MTLPNAKAYSDHPNLFVSAENSLFNNYFSGPMVVEVMVTEASNQLDQALGEPNVSVAGKRLRMVQGSDSNWYGFFANTDMAKQADQAALSGAPGQSTDFGVFCSGSTSASVLGIDISQTDGVAIPDSAGLSGTTQGNTGFNSCTGNATSPSSQNNVVRNPPSLNTNPKVPVGQIGINPNVWPLIQLFTLSDNVHIEYDGSTGTQSVDLTYSSNIPNISIKLDRNAYPAGSDVFATINDIELSIDPTSQNSWTFNVGSPQATFYQAFSESGRSASGSGLVNLLPYLSNLGFQDNGKLSMDASNVVNLKTNSLQTSSSLNGMYNQLVTFVETGPHTGIFESSYASISTIGTLPNAPRGNSGSITYDQQSVSIVSGTSTGSLTVGTAQSQFNPGQKETITLVDNTQNLNSNQIDQLDVFRSSARIPTLEIGTPITLSSSSDVTFYNTSSTLTVPSAVFDSNSLRLIVDTRSQSMSNFQKITINLGISANSLQNLLIDTSQPNSNGTNWINYDLRSFQQQLGITSFSGTSMTLYFGSVGNLPVQILAPGTIDSGNGLVQISDATVASIASISSGLPVYLEINFNTSGEFSNPSDTQPIVFDLFSFGSKNEQQVNNAIYRAELQETSANSGVFTGTMEYAVINQLNQFDPNLIKSLSTFGSNIKFLVSNELTDANAIHFSIIGSQQGGSATPVTSQSNLPTHTGIVTLDSSNYRIGSDVTITVNDPDLATDADTIVTYSSVNDPGSPADDTVGDNDGNILLEVWIKGFRFHHCTIDGVNYGGLAATGFTLTETGPGTGIFQGIFKMPSQICNEDGTALISSVGGSVQAWYHDYRDQFGRSVIIPAIVASSATAQSTTQSAITTVPYNTVSKSTQISDSSGRPLLQNPHVGQAINFQSMITNNNYSNYQNISYIVQIKDSNNKVVFLKWSEDNLANLSTMNEELQWTPTSPGVYSAEVYVWNGMDSLVPLIDNSQYTIQVLP
ncbi:MAG: peptidase [Nitrosotalea sp.]